ncbi:MAG: 4a-hydroxytetrahydrobiopterin dehydratase [Acidobacteriaceae bacterium]|nr:4a-hydroxytetrahydrobiopterin dehydratase [Acidobacteriaceae bacterium]
MAAKKLSDQEISQALQGLPEWRVENEKLHRDFKFPDFAHAFGFMTASAIQIEKRNHHPEWLNVYNRVCVELTTHDAGGITQKDIELATMLDQMAAKLSR